MATKQEKIAKMIEMQKKFTAYEQSGEFNAEDYYVGEWKDYREEYTALATDVREMASKEANYWK